MAFVAMKESRYLLAIGTFLALCVGSAVSFHFIGPLSTAGSRGIRQGRSQLSEALKDASVVSNPEPSVWEEMAKVFHPGDLTGDIDEIKAYTQTVSLLRVGIPSLFLASSSNIAYPFVAIALANMINDSGVFAVVAQDASQYIQNILTTSGKSKF